MCSDGVNPAQGPRDSLTVVKANSGGGEGAWGITGGLGAVLRSSPWTWCVGVRWPAPVDDPAVETICRRRSRLYAGGNSAARCRCSTRSRSSPIVPGVVMIFRAFFGQSTSRPPMAKEPPSTGQSPSTKQSIPRTGTSWPMPSRSSSSLTRSTCLWTPSTSFVQSRRPTVSFSTRGERMPPLMLSWARRRDRSSVPTLGSVEHQVRFYGRVRRAADNSPSLAVTTVPRTTRPQEL